jgi:NADH:ubiquinone oxidoreductase subunit B-like Fe-S oxidoreductase
LTELGILLSREEMKLFFKAPPIRVRELWVAGVLQTKFLALVLKLVSQKMPKYSWVIDILRCIGLGYPTGDEL